MMSKTTLVLKLSLEILVGLLGRFTWYLLSARFLKVDWLIKFKWVVPMLICHYLILSIVYLPGLRTSGPLKSVIPYIPLITTIVEFIAMRVVKSMLIQDQDNIR